MSLGDKSRADLVGGATAQGDDGRAALTERFDQSLGSSTGDIVEHENECGSVTVCQRERPAGETLLLRLPLRPTDRFP